MRYVLHSNGTDDYFIYSLKIKIQGEIPDAASIDFRGNSRLRTP
jgi:hypothetical protein